MTPPLRSDICARCHQAITRTEAPRLITIHLARGRRERFRLEDIVAVEAKEKGLWFYLRDGRKLYDYSSAKEIEQRYPGEFLRLNRGILARPDAIKAVARHPDMDENYVAELEGLAEPLTISRREWRKVAAALGWSIPQGNLKATPDTLKNLGR